MAIAPSSAAILGQTDDFEDGTTQNWHVGSLGAPSPAPPQNIASGGPAGADDNYLLLTALGGGGAGSRLTVNNFFTQWAGDYTSAGITYIGLDLRNFGTSDLNIRLFLENPTVGPPTDTGFTQDFFLPAGGGWVNVQFNVTAAGLTSASGDLQTLLSGVTGLRIYHSVADGFPGDPIVAALGVDNITAQTPEPSTLAFAALGLAALALQRLRATRD